MQITIGKLGKSVDVARERFSDEVAEYVFAYGLTQVLNDAHSQLTTKSGASPDEIMAAVEKKLQAMYDGKVRTNRGPGAPRDPLMAIVHRLAKGEIKVALAKAGKKLGDVDKEALAKAVAKRIEDHDERLRAVAQAELDQINAVDVDLDDLFVAGEQGKLDAEEAA